MYEKLLDPNSNGVPTCRCGLEMAFTKLEYRSADTMIKFFACDSCGHEMRLMVWCDDVSSAGTQGLPAKVGDGLKR